MKAIGIDLGTTNSVMTHVRNGKIEVLATSMNEEHTPSVVCYRKRKGKDEGEYIVGTQAVRVANMHPQTTVRSVKRLMGRSFDDERVQETLKRMEYRVVPAEDAENDKGVYIDFGDARLSPVEISAKILAKMKEDASKALGETVTHAVITVPAYFQEKQRAATREAGELAGLEVLRVIDEPTAAAIAYGADAAKDEGRRALVYDLGGGTFDVSLIKILNDQYVVDRIAGDNWLGGDDFDREIASLILEKLETEQGENRETLEKDPVFAAELRRISEDTKKALGASSTVDVCEMCRRTGADSLAMEVTIERDEFVARIGEHVKRSIEQVEKILADSGTEADSVHDVILVGGSTAVPSVHDAVSGLFGGDKIRRTLNPMHCVAQGAGRLAEDLMRTVDSAVGGTTGAPVIALSQTTALNLGIQVKDGDNLHAFGIIIPAGTSYPLSKPIFRRYAAVDHNQKTVRVSVFEGTGANVTDFDVNKQGELVIDVEAEFGNKEGLPQNHPIDIGFDYDKDRTVTLLVNVEGTGKTLQKRLEHRDLTVDGLDFDEDDELEDEDDDDVTGKNAGSDEEVMAYLSRELKHLQFFLDRRRRLLREDQVETIQGHIKRGREVLLAVPFNRGMAEVMVDFVTEDINNSGVASTVEAIENIANAPIQAATRDRLRQGKDALIQAYREHGEHSDDYLRILDDVTDTLADARAQVNVGTVNTVSDSGGAVQAGEE